MVYSQSLHGRAPPTTTLRLHREMTAKQIQQWLPRGRALGTAKAAMQGGGMARLCHRRFLGTFCRRAKSTIQESQHGLAHLRASVTAKATMQGGGMARLCHRRFWILFPPCKKYHNSERIAKMSERSLRDLKNFTLSDKMCKIKRYKSLWFIRSRSTAERRQQRRSGCTAK